MLKINKVSLVDNQFTDEELKTGGLCTLDAATTTIGKGVWHFVKDGTATCIAAETAIAALPADASCKVEELVLKLTKTVRREIPVAENQTEVITGLKGLTKVTKAEDVVSSTDATIGEVTAGSGKFALAAGAKAGVLVADLEVTVGDGAASHPSMDAAHQLELKDGEPLHVVLYANAKNLEGAKPNVTDLRTRNSRIGITAY